VVRLLLEKGADVNAQGGHYGNALQAASVKSNEAVVRLLLEKGADVNAQRGHYGNALKAASAHRQRAVVKLLENSVNKKSKSWKFWKSGPPVWCFEFHAWYLMAAFGGPWGSLAALLDSLGSVYRLCQSSRIL
jgi:ankyrin repeat protein